MNNMITLKNGWQISTTKAEEAIKDMHNLDRMFGDDRHEYSVEDGARAIYNWFTGYGSDTADYPDKVIN